MGDASVRVVAVAGATGFVGRHVVRALVSRGFGVRALVRDRGRAARVLGTMPRVELVCGDVCDTRVPAALGEGAGAWVNCIGIRREIPPGATFEGLHVRATALQVGAARRGGVRRFVQVSALGTRPGASTAYHRSKYEGERIVRESGLSWTILRPSLIHGSDGEFMEMARAWALGRAPPFVFMPYFARVRMRRGFPWAELESAVVQPVHVDEVASAVVESLVRAEAEGEVYPVVGSESLDWPNLLRAVRDSLPAAARGKRAMPLPGRAASMAARVAAALGLGGSLPFGPSEPIMAIEDNTGCCEKVKTHLGLTTGAFTKMLGCG